MKMFIPFSAIIFTLIVLSASVSAKIYHVSVPDQASPGETITATLSSASFIENWDDFGVIWGLVAIPDITTGSYTFVAAVPHLVGISGVTGINYFTQAIELVCKQ
ncbi:hypothetical protein D1P53_006174 [Cryptococcus gattii VGV]|nr:hypothetical protein D1P53_006174 [Cryptococcus gattii VGV]